MTVLLTSLLSAFRARRETRISWLPITWALYLLVIQFDVWWDLYGLVFLQTWSAGAFVLLLLIAFVLFAAGGLVLPTGLEAEYPADLGVYFEQDGRWAVALVIAFTVLGTTANIALFDLPALHPMNLFNAGAIVILVAALQSARPGLQRAATIAYGGWLLAYLWIFVPSTY